MEGKCSCSEQLVTVERGGFSKYMDRTSALAWCLWVIGTFLSFGIALIFFVVMAMSDKNNYYCFKCQKLVERADINLNPKS